MCRQTSGALLSVDQLHHLFLSSVLVFKKWIIHLQIVVSTTGKSLLPSFYTHKCGAHQWNKLLEKCCMKYEIFVWCNKSIYFSMEQRTLWNKKRKFLEIYIMERINCIAWESVAQLQMLSCFSSIQMERLQQIPWNIISLVCTGLQVCCTQYIYETCFIQYVS